MNFKYRTWNWGRQLEVGTSHKLQIILVPGERSQQVLMNVAIKERTVCTPKHCKLGNQKQWLLITGSVGSGIPAGKDAFTKEPAVLHTELFSKAEASAGWPCCK